MKFFKSEDEGWMGNYGNTEDRWYHRAAVVMWPRERNFIIRAKLAPAWAIDELWVQIKQRAVKDAAERARSLLPFWSWAAPKEPSATFFGTLLKALDALGRDDLSAGLLAPLGPRWLSARTVPGFVKLLLQHGLPWSKQLLSKWAEQRRYGESAAWLPILAAAELLRTCRLKRTQASVRALGLAPLYLHVVDSLTQSAAEPLRKKQQELLAWLTPQQTAFCDVAADDTQCEEVGRLP
jgi:hypothetical protein